MRVRLSSTQKYMVIFSYSYCFADENDRMTESMGVGISAELAESVQQALTSLSDAAC